MKVLGVGDDKYICEVSYSEIYEILDGNISEEDFEINAGDEINLMRVVRAAEWVKKLDSNHLDSIIRELQLTLVGVEKVKETAVALNLFNRLRDKEKSE